MTTAWSASRNAILNHWKDNTTIVVANRSFDAVGGSKFTPPAIVPATPATAIWCRISIVTLPRTTRPFGIGSAAHKYHEGLVYRQIFFPRGFGEKFVDATVEAEEALFHRRSLASGLVRFRDCYVPERIPPEADDAPWSQINVVNPYYVIDPATAEN